MASTLQNRIAIFALMLALAGVYGVPSLHADNTPYRMESLPSNDVFSDFVVGPGKVELTLKPGESKTINVSVSNRLGEERTFDIVTEDIKGSEDPEQTVVLMGNERGPYSLKDFFEYSAASFVLPHAKKAIVPITIHAPEKAEPGGYYGSVLFKTAPNKTGADGAVAGAAIVSRIGILFFVTVPGSNDYKGNLESFITKAGSIFTKGPIVFQLRFRNSGNIHLDPSGEISIKNMIGTEVDRVPVETWFALPQSLRSREVIWDRGYLMGRYTATAKIDRGYDDQKDTMSLTFWVIPWQPIAIVLGIILVLFFIIRFFASHFEVQRKR